MICSLLPSDYVAVKNQTATFNEHYRWWGTFPPTQILMVIWEDCYKDVAIAIHRLPLTVCSPPQFSGPLCPSTMFVAVYLNRETKAMKIFRQKLLKRKTLVAKFCSSLSPILFLQNASLVTTDSQAPLINAPNENVWLWVAECDCLKPLGFWSNPTWKTRA